MFAEDFQERKERGNTHWKGPSHPRSASAHVPGHIPLHQRRRQTSDLWNGLLWQPKHIPVASMSAPIRESNGHLTPPRDLDDLSMNSDVEVILPASTRLRRMIYHSEKIIVAPGALSVGFDAMYMVRNLVVSFRIRYTDRALDWCGNNSLKAGDGGSWYCPTS